MPLDPDHPVVKLCAAGMEAEHLGNMEEAKRLFMHAWDVAQDNFSRCIAAHYVARHQETPADTLRWNIVALDLGLTLADDDQRDFLPSLYLNAGHSHEVAGALEEARRLFGLGAAYVGQLPAGPYQEMMSKGLAAGLERVHR